MDLRAGPDRCGGVSTDEYYLAQAKQCEDDARLCAEGSESRSKLIMSSLRWRTLVQDKRLLVTPPDSPDEPEVASLT